MRPTVREFFDNYLDDLDTLFLNLEAYFHKRLLPRTAPDAEAVMEREELTQLVR